MKAITSTLALLAATVFAQERCDAADPKVFCNTTEILAYQTSDCRPYHIFIVRGSEEPYPGRQGNLTRDICSRIGSTDCGFENVEYPAKSTAWGKEEWCKSASTGAANGLAQMKAYNQKCPDSELILLGYSQGGAVAQNILSGGGGKVFECELPSNPALDMSIGSKIIAAATFGAVIRSKNQNFTMGGGKDFDGQRARTPDEQTALNQYSDRFRDYCNQGDPMCAVGSTPVSVYAHLSYFVEHGEEVAEWVAGKVAQSNDKSSDSSVSESSVSSSVSPSASSSASLPASSSATSSTLASATRSATSTPSAQPVQSGTVGTGATTSLCAPAGYALLVVAGFFFTI